MPFLRPFDSNDVDNHIHSDYGDTQTNLNLSGQPLGVECSGHVALYKAPSISDLSSTDTQIYFQGCKWADPSC